MQVKVYKIKLKVKGNFIVSCKFDFLVICW